MRFLQLDFRSHPIIVEADSVKQTQETVEQYELEQPDKTLTLIFNTAFSYEMRNAEGTQILRPGEIAVLFPCRYYVLSPLWESSDITENRMIRIRVLLSDLSVVYCDTDDGHTLSYVTQMDTDNSRLLFPEHICPDDKVYQSLVHLSQKMIAHYYADTVSERYLAIARWYEIAALLDTTARSALLEQQLLQSQSNIPSNSLYIRRAKQYIREHYKEHLSLSGIAYILKLSPNYLSAIFKKETGSSITEYISYYRIQKLRELLFNETQTNLSELCHAVGFTDKRYAQRLFKKYFGVTMQECIRAERWSADMHRTIEDDPDFDDDSIF